MQISGIPFFDRAIEKGVSLITNNILEMVPLEVGQDYYIEAQVSDPDEALGRSIADGTRKRLMARIYSFSSKILQEWSELNRKRLKEGKPPLDIYTLTREIESITNNSSLPDKEKEIKINEVRKRVGLEEGDMKKFFTERLEKIYDESKQELEKKLGVLQENVVRMQDVYGKESPQALAAARRLEVVSRINQPLLQTLENNRGLYSRMYPPAGSCIKKVFGGIGSMFKGLVNTVGNFAKGIINPKNWLKPGFWLNVVAPMALHFIPGLGTVAAVAYRWGKLISRGVNIIKDLAQGKWDSLVNLGISVLGKVGQELKKVAVPAIEKVNEWIDKGKDYYQKGMEIYRKVTEWPTKWIDQK